MDKIRLRVFSKLQYCDPYKFLTELRLFEYIVANSATPKAIRTLRTNGLKAMREMRDVAIFCVGMSEHLDCKVCFSAFEEQDYDFVSRWEEDGWLKYCPIQLKEIVPEELNETITVQKIIDKLERYTDSADVTFVLKLNRVCQFNPSDIVISDNLSIGGLWVFGSVSEDQSEFALWGNFLNSVQNDMGIKFLYPSTSFH